MSDLPKWPKWVENILEDYLWGLVFCMTCNVTFSWLWPYHLSTKVTKRESWLQTIFEGSLLSWPNNGCCYSLLRSKFNQEQQCLKLCGCHIKVIICNNFKMIRPVQPADFVIFIHTYLLSTCSASNLIL